MNRKQYDIKSLGTNLKNRAKLKSDIKSCSFITIPKGLKQHAIAAAIIHCAPAKRLSGKLPDPSVKWVID